MKYKCEDIKLNKIETTLTVSIGDISVSIPILTVGTEEEVNPESIEGKVKQHIALLQMITTESIVKIVESKWK